LLFAKYGYANVIVPSTNGHSHNCGRSAKVAVGDINEQACQDVAWQISQSGGYVLP
jgi:hypothetical protein